MNRRQRLANNTAKGSTPFSAPALFAGSSRASQRAQSRANAGTRTTSRSAPISKSFSVISRPMTIKSNGKYSDVPFQIEVAVINNTTTFTAQSFALNPGLSSTFGTRLANIASGFEKYRFLNLSSTYVPTAAVTTTAGQVYQAAEYDPNDAPPDSLQALSTYQTNVNDRVYEKKVMSFDIGEMFSGVQWKKIRSGPVPGDLQTHDGGSLIIATDDGANTNAIGKVWLSGTVRFCSPQTDPPARVPRDMVVLNVSANQTLATGVPEAIDFDESISSGFTVTDSTGVYTIPPGAYEIFGEVTFSDSSAESFTGSIELKVNGASTVPPQTSASLSTSVANGSIPVPFHFFASFEVSSTIRIEATATGAAGTLVAVADRTRLFIKAV